MASEEIKKGVKLTIPARSLNLQPVVRQQESSSPPDISPYKILYNNCFDDGLQAMIKVWKAVSKKRPDAYFFCE